MLPYRITHRSSDKRRNCTSCCKLASVDFGNLKKLKNVLDGVPCVSLQSELDEILHTFPSRQITVYMAIPFSHLYYLWYPVL